MTGESVAEANLASFANGPDGAADPSRSVSWNLAGHWWELSGFGGRARPGQDSAFSEKWCCKNGVGASQAIGKAIGNLGMKVNS